LSSDEQRMLARQPVRRGQGFLILGDRRLSEKATVLR